MRDKAEQMSNSAVSELDESRSSGQDSRKLISVIYEWVEELAIALAIIAIAFTFIFRIITVTGTSMVPNFQDGDRVVVAGKYLQNYRQGDVVVVVNALKEPIIKRIIATEGQTVNLDLKQKAVIVDGKVLDDSKFGVANGITEMPFSSYESIEFPQKVPEGSVFVLGDNRKVSEDSRYKDIGMIDSRNILGKAIINIYDITRKK